MTIARRTEAASSLQISVFQRYFYFLCFALLIWQEQTSESLREHLAEGRQSLFLRTWRVDSQLQ